MRFLWTNSAPDPPASTGSERHSNVASRHPHRGILHTTGFTALAFALSASASATEFARVNYFIGNDPRKWISKISDYPVLSYQPPLLDLAPYSVNITGATRNLQPLKIAADSQGGVYIAGNVLWPRVGLPGSSLTSDVSVMRLDATGRVLFTTYFGGDDSDGLTDMAVDAAGRVYLAGSTASLDFPVVNPIQSERRGAVDGFVCQLSPTGEFLYSTYIVGGQFIYGVAADTSGNAYVTGFTQSPDFPTTPGAFQTRPLQPNAFQRPANAFVFKMSPDGKRLVYSTLLGGTQVTCSGGSSCIPAAPFDVGRAIAVDNAGNAYIAGSTNSLDFPVTSGALQSVCNCAYRRSTGFLTKLNPAGSSLVFSTYFGGTPILEFHSGATITSLAVDSSSAAYLAGSTTATDFPTTPGAFRPDRDPATSRSGRPTAFVSKFSAAGALVYSTLLSGKVNETGNAVQVDAQGNAYVVGNTQVADFPVSAGAFSRGGEFFVKLNPSGSALPFSTLLPSGFGAQAVALDSSGNVYLLGSSGYVSRIQGSSNRLPAILGVSNAARSFIGGRIAPGELISIFGADIGPGQPTGLQLDQNGRVSTTLAGVQVLVDGFPAPLTFAQRDQINAVVPFELQTSGTDPSIRVLRNGTDVGQIRLRSVFADPDVFRVAGGSQAAAINEDGTINSQQSPAKYGSIVAIFATGLGGFDDSLQDGQIATDRLPKPRLPVSVQDVFLSRPLEVLYAGQAPQLVAGVMQINFRVPSSQAGNPLVLRAGDAASTSFSVYVGP